LFWTGAARAARTASQASGRARPVGGLGPSRRDALARSDGEQRLRRDRRDSAPRFPTTASLRQIALSTTTGSRRTANRRGGRVQYQSARVY
jgi:hypothetical protein